MSPLKVASDCEATTSISSINEARQHWRHYRSVVFCSITILGSAVSCDMIQSSPALSLRCRSYCLLQCQSGPRLNIIQPWRSRSSSSSQPWYNYSLDEMVLFRTLRRFLYIHLFTIYLWRVQIMNQLLTIYSNHKRTTEIHINVNLDIKPYSHARKQINKNISNSPSIQPRQPL